MDVFHEIMKKERNPWIIISLNYNKSIDMTKSSFCTVVGIVGVVMAFRPIKQSFSNGDFVSFFMYLCVTAFFVWIFLWGYSRLPKE